MAPGRKNGLSIEVYGTRGSLSFDLDEVFERVLVDRGDERFVFSIGKHGILWKNDRVDGEFLGHTEAWAAFTHLFVG